MIANGLLRNVPASLWYKAELFVRQLVCDAKSNWRLDNSFENVLFGEIKNQILDWTR